MLNERLQTRKKKKLEEVIAKSRRLTDYMLFKPSSCAAVKNSDDETHSPGPSQSQDFEDGEVEVVSSIKIIYYKSCRAPRPKWLLYCLKKFLKKCNVIIVKNPLFNDYIIYLLFDSK